MLTYPLGLHRSLDCYNDYIHYIHYIPVLTYHLTIIIIVIILELWKRNMGA